MFDCLLPCFFRAKPSREDRGRAEERIALQLAAAASQPSGEGMSCAWCPRICGSKVNLYLDLDHEQALAAMGLPDDGSNGSESFLDARRGAMWDQMQSSSTATLKCNGQSNGIVATGTWG